MIEKWNRKEIKILALHPKSGGHGLNLQEGGHVMIWYSIPWSLEQYLQANKRLDRKGQEEKVKIYHILAEKCIDFRVIEALEMKANTQEEVLAHLRKTL